MFQVDHTKGIRAPKHRYGGSSRADACSDTELICTHEVGPLVEMLSGAKGIAVNETTDGVAGTGGAVVVELASLIARSPWLVIYKVDAIEGVLGHHAGAVDGLCPVDDHLFFNVTDWPDGGRSLQAEVADVVEHAVGLHYQRLCE